MAVGTTTAIVAAISAIGAGISAYGSYQQGQSQNAIAQFNAANQEKAAKAQLLSMQTQAEMQKRDAEANFKLRQAEANARNANASALEKQALQQDGIDRINAAKKRGEMARMQAQQRATIAASGVSESSGTPLDILAETAAKIQIGQEEDAYANEVSRWTLLGEAQRERFGGKLALAGATLDADSEVAAAGLRSAAARAGFANDIAGAQITRLTGKAAKSAATAQAAGTLLSGASSIYGRV